MEFPTVDDIGPVVPEVELPTFARVRYEPETPELGDVPGAVSDAVDALPLDGLDVGDTVAVGVGSRGIDRLELVVRTVVETLRDRELNPVVIPAMGSHGGATSEGQRGVLDEYGISEGTLGCPVDARTETTVLGESAFGFPVHWSKAALEADATIVVNRVKAHTNFRGSFESGLTKMAVIGVGKQRGAQRTHEYALREDYEPVLRAALDVIREKANLAGGIALVENFDHRLAEISGLPAGDLPDGETPLLERASEYMPTLPYDEFNVLVVDRMGKDVSGAGMDTNVIGRYRILNADDPQYPDIDRIYVRGLTEATHGNGAGIGLADFTRQSLVDDLDLSQVYTNLLTSNSVEKGSIPVVLPDDDHAIRAALGGVGPYDPATTRVVWIRDTGHLSEFRISEALVDEVPEVEVDCWEEIRFDDGEATFVEVDRID